MALRKLTIVTRKGDDVSLLSDMLIELGALSVSVSDKHQDTELSQSIFADVQDEEDVQTSHRQQDLWVESNIQSWFPLEVDAETMLMNLATTLALNRIPTFTVETWDGSNDWVSEMKKYLQPLDIGDTRIDFPGIVSHLTTTPKFRLLLEPGAAFGTGQHATTQLCVRWLSSELPSAQCTTLLDYGCGNGVLAIRAALHQSRIQAVGVDIDPDAVHEAKLNAVRNGVQMNTRFFSSDDQPEGSTYDIVIANILASVLQSVAPFLVSRVKKNGRIALSGILCSQAMELKTTFERLGIKMVQGEVQAGWTILSGFNNC